MRVNGLAKETSHDTVYIFNIPYINFIETSSKGKCLLTP